MSDSYVYGILVDGLLRYVGKGSGVFLKRAEQHPRNARNFIAKRAAGSASRVSRVTHHLAKAMLDSAVVSVIVLQANLSERDAYDLEASLVPESDSLLWNSRSGGEGGWRPDKETRCKQSAAAKQRLQRAGEKERLASVGHSLEARLSRSAELKKYYASSPDGVERSRRMAQQNWQCPERAARMLLGKANLRPPTAEERKKIWSDPARAEKQRSAMQRKWAEPGYKERLLEKRRAWAATPAGKAEMARILALRWGKKNG